MMVTYAKGALVDHQGFVLGLVRWDASSSRPTVNKPRAGDANVRPEHKKQIVPFKAGAPTIHNITSLRWNGKQWEKPDRTLWLVDERGNARKAVKVFKQFPDHVPELPDGWQYVEEAPPQDHSGRASWIEGKWRFPDKFRIMNADGSVANIVLAHAMDDIQIQIGQSVIQHSDADSISPGDRFDGTQWVKPKVERKGSYLAFLRVLKQEGLLKSFKAWGKQADNEDELLLHNGPVGESTGFVLSWAATEGISSEALHELFVKVAEETSNLNSS